MWEADQGFGWLQVELCRTGLNGQKQECVRVSGPPELGRPSGDCDRGAGSRWTRTAATDNRYHALNDLQINEQMTAVFALMQKQGFLCQLPPDPKETRIRE